MGIKVVYVRKRKSLVYCESRRWDRKKKNEEETYDVLGV
jgi:hypothetical protein